MKILLTTDGSLYAEGAMEVLLYRPWPADTQVLLVAVVEPLHEQINKTFSAFGLGKTALDAQHRVRDHIKSLMAGYEKRLVEKFGRDKVEARTLEGAAKSLIVETAAEWGADAIVMGAHGVKGNTTFAYGSVTEAVISHAACTVEILRPASAHIMVKELANKQPIEEDKYLLAIDDSEHSQAMLDVVLSRQWPKDSYFKVVHVIEPLPFDSYAALGPWEDAEAISKVTEDLRNAQVELATQLVEDFAAKIKAKFADAKISSQVVDGHAPEKIIEIAREWPADLIVMGSHGRRGLTEFMLGSVSRNIAMNSPCSVMIVRAPHLVSGGKGKVKSSAAAR